MPKASVKRVLGELPWAADLDWSLRGKGRPVGAFKLEELKEALPSWCEQVQDSPHLNAPGKKVLMFATLHYWIGHAVLTALALRGMGHQVTVATLPYANWQKPLNKFDARKRELYIEEVLQPAKNLIDHVSFAGEGNPPALSGELQEASHRRSISYGYSIQLAGRGCRSGKRSVSPASSAQF